MKPPLGEKVPPPSQLSRALCRPRGPTAPPPEKRVTLPGPLWVRRGSAALRRQFVR